MEAEPTMQEEDDSTQGSEGSANALPEDLGDADLDLLQTLQERSEPLSWEYPVCQGCLTFSDTVSENLVQYFWL